MWREVTQIELLKKTTFLELIFFITGKVNVFCDISIEAGHASRRIRALTQKNLALAR